MYEIIELSLLKSGSKTDIASKLFEVEGKPNMHLIVNVFLGLCSNGYNSNKFNADFIFTLLYQLVSNKIDIAIVYDIETQIHYISDGHYLATEGIYGNIEEICRDLKKFLDRIPSTRKSFILINNFYYTVQ